MLEVGARGLGLGTLIRKFEPREFIGVDVRPGPGVDLVCDASALIERFGPSSFDLVISTEMVEHVRDWRVVVSNLKRVCKGDGHVLLTTRSFGYGYHGAPGDFWRFEIDDLFAIFRDFDIEVLERDPTEPGVFIYAKKPKEFVERSLADVSLYSIVLGRRTSNVEALARRGLAARRNLLEDLGRKVRQLVWHAYKRL